MAGRVKRKDHENLSDENIQKVIEALRATPPITKTEACKRLNITYNPKRLDKIIEEFEETKAREKKLRDANRGKAAQPHEIKYVIEQYIKGEPLGEIAKQLYRPSSFVSSIIQKVGVPTRGVGEDYINYSPLPDSCIADTFQPDEIAWSAKYRAPCLVIKQCGKTVDDESNVYRIYVIEPYEEPEFKWNLGSVGSLQGFFAHQPAYELGKLDHLKQYGVDVTKMV